MATSTTLGADTEACTVLSPDELAVAAGGSWTEPPIYTALDGGFQCYYESESDGTALAVTVCGENFVAPDGIEGGAVGYLDKLLADLAALGLNVIEIDAGDRAFYTSTSGNVHMQVGETAITVFPYTSTTDVDFDQEAMTIIAQNIANNIRAT